MLALHHPVLFNTVTPHILRGYSTCLELSLSYDTRNDIIIFKLMFLLILRVTGYILHSEIYYFQPISLKPISNHFTFSSAIGGSGRCGGPMATPSIVSKCLATVIGVPVHSIT